MMHGKVGDKQDAALHLETVQMGYRGICVIGTGGLFDHGGLAVFAGWRR